MEYLTFEDSEWYEIDPDDQGNHLDSYTISLKSFRSPIPQTSMQYKNALAKYFWNVLKNRSNEIGTNEIREPPVTGQELFCCFLQKTSSSGNYIFSTVLYQRQAYENLREPTKIGLIFSK